jgi:hypothetical protein
MVPDTASEPDTCVVDAEFLVCGESAGLAGSFALCCEAVYGSVATLDKMFMRLVIMSVAA